MVSPHLAALPVFGNSAFGLPVGQNGLVQEQPSGDEKTWP